MDHLLEGAEDTPLVRSGQVVLVGDGVSQLGPHPVGVDLLVRKDLMHTMLFKCHLRDTSELAVCLFASPIMAGKM